MSVEAYEDLARSVLVLLIQSGELRAVERDRTIAYETYYLPARICLELPDADAHMELLNPKTKREHAALLADALMRVVVQEERDSWVVLRSTVEIISSFAQSADMVAEPVYDVASRNEEVLSKDIEEYSEPVLRVKIEDEVHILRRGQGLLPLVRSNRRPRVSILEADGSGHEVAFLVVSGDTLVETADGREKNYDAHSKIPITHDMNFTVSSPMWKIWRGSVKGEVEILGVSRSHRPGLIFFPKGVRGGVEWDRNRTPMLRVGPNEGQDIHAPSLDFALGLESGGGDAILVDSVERRATWLTWFDDAPLWVPPMDPIPLQGGHLQALGHDQGSVRVRVSGNRPASPPAHVRVRGWLPPKKPKDPFSGLFGFEQPVVTVFEEGVVLGSSYSTQEIQVPVSSPDLVRDLFEIAVDGCEGCKVKPKLVELHAENHELHTGAWSWVEGVVILTMPGLRLRVEALRRVQMIYDTPQPIRELSADPEDVWNIDGWRLQFAEDSLFVHGKGREEIYIDHVRINAPTELEGRREHRVQVRDKVYRVVRRDFERPGATR